MNPDDAESVLAEAAQVMQVELHMVETELVLKSVLPELLDKMLGAVARRFTNEIIALHSRIDQLEQHRGH